MKKQAMIFAVTATLSGTAAAIDFGTLFEEPLVHEADYNYADASVLFQPDNYKGFELNGSYILQPNLAVTGVFNRVSAAVSLTQLGLGGRYFYALPTLEKADLDLSVQLLNNRASGGNTSKSTTALVLGAQLRYLMDTPIGDTSLNLQEAYGGLQLSVSSDDFSVAFHAGLLVAINAQFSAKAELLIDDGTYLTLGARTKLGRVQRNQDPSAYQAKLAASAAQPVAVPAAAPQVVITPSATQPSLLENPYGLTESEMSDFKKAAE